MITILKRERDILEQRLKLTREQRDICKDIAEKSKELVMKLRNS